MEGHWQHALKAHVEKKPVAVLRLGVADWAAVRGSRRGVGEFTTALPHDAYAKLQAPTVCLLLAEDAAGHHAYLGVIGPPSPITTLQSRVKVKRAAAITPAAPVGLVDLLENPMHRRTLSERLSSDAPLSQLSPKLSGHLVERLASLAENAGPMRTVASSLAVPRRFRGNDALQDDAIRTALRAFGLGPDDKALSLDLARDRHTALARVPIMEDGAIEHDARRIPGYELVGSDLTGRAVFERGGERLEVFTANRRPLERAFGVDLIYLNATRRNIVMLQYKMLEAPEDEADDWTFSPDRRFRSELERMRRFARAHTPGPVEYRLNPTALYLKFVKRDGVLRRGGVLMPIDHYDRFVQQDAARGPRGGVRVSYAALGGSYMREQPFLDLLRAGYIGAYADTTAQLEVLIKGVLTRGRALVAAIQASAPSAGAVIEPVDEDDDFEF